MIHFLLVEDDEDHAILVRRALERDRVGNKVSHVSDGESAWQYLTRVHPFEQAENPDIILLDLKLPKVDGLEVLKRIKQSPELSKIPVVVMTTSDAETDRARAYEFHANSYLVKPINFERFKQMVIDLSLYWGVWNIPPVSDEGN